jgi:hypothetical protein
LNIDGWVEGKLEGSFVEDVEILVMSGEEGRERYRKEKETSYSPSVTLSTRRYDSVDRFQNTEAR